jgi:hypothetical protein
MTPAIILVLCNSIQLTLIAGQLLPWTSLQLYVLFCMAGGVLFILARFVYKKGTFRTFAALELIVTAGMLSAGYQMMIYDYAPQLAKTCFWFLVGLSMTSKICAGVLEVKFKNMWNRIEAAGDSKSIKRIVQGLGIVLIVLMVGVPNSHRLVALSFIGEQWHHLDFFVMSPGLSVMHGGRPYVDVLSQYGVGIPVVLPKLAKLCGGFDYSHVMAIVVACGVLYFVATFLFLRFWLGSIVLSFAAVLCAIRINLCHFGVSPLVWIYPSASPIRLCFDIAFFACLLLFAQSRKMLWLIIAGLWTGLSIYFMSSTGVSLMLAFDVFIILSLVLSVTKPHVNVKQIGKALILMALPLVTALTAIYMSVGDAAWGKTFWSRWAEYIQYFSNGHAGGVLPFYDSLKYRNYLSWLMGAVIPIGYLLSTLYALSLWRRALLGLGALVIVAMGIYGLSQYSYYVVRSAQTSYYMVGLPFVWLGAFWIKVALDKYTAHKRKAVLVLLLVLSAYALWTNHNFLSYPNFVSLSKDALVDKRLITRFPDRQGYFNHQVKGIDPSLPTEDSFPNEAALLDYVKRSSDFSKDAELIRSLTGPNEKVALISSFETAILLQADRAPFFYHIPLLTSQPMSVRGWATDAAHSPRFLEDTLGQLKRSLPEYVFMENIFLIDQVPSSYVQSHANVLALVKYVRERYAPIQQGQNITALKLSSHRD